MIGYKLLNKSMIQDGINYQLGKEHIVQEKPFSMNNGFRFCTDPTLCVGYEMNFDGDKRFF